MTTHVRHLNAKFAGDPTDLLNWLPKESEKYRFLEIFSKEMVFVTSSIYVKFFALLKNGKVSSCSQVQACQA